jgi:hypothetical protein
MLIKYLVDQILFLKQVIIEEKNYKRYIKEIINKI